MPTTDPLAYYAAPGPLTDPGPYRDDLLRLPAGGPELYAAVRGLLLHEQTRERHGVAPAPEHRHTTHLRPVTRLLARLLADGPLTRAREPSHRLVGTCRHYAVLTVAAMRAHGVPARARCGFAAYFPVPNFEDHWVVEYWDAQRSGWVLADPQIDHDMREEFGVDIDYGDLPRDQFIVAGQAWNDYRAGRVDPDRFGLSWIDAFGAWWIADNLIRDVAALARHELLPWDGWGAMEAPHAEVEPANLAMFDAVAAITADPSTAADARVHHDRDERLRVPERVFNFLRATDEPVLPDAD